MLDWATHYCDALTGLPRTVINEALSGSEVQFEMTGSGESLFLLLIAWLRDGVCP